MPRPHSKINHSEPDSLEVNRLGAPSKPPASRAARALGSSPLEALVSQVTQEVARLVLDGLRAGSDPDWFDQSRSPVGNRRHCSIVRRRIAEGKPGAAIAGRRLLLSREALEEELARGSEKPPKVDPEADVRDLAGELGLRLVGGKR
jgi:hypothetical protein